MKAFGVAATILVLACGVFVTEAGDDCCWHQCGGGYGWGRGPRPGQGPQGAHHDSIHALLDHHDAIERSVKVLDDGVETVTTSADPEVTQKIRLHVRQMEQRMKSGRWLRRWDPLFVELFRNHDKVRMEIEDVPGGVRVLETSDDPQVALLIRQHALRGVNEFVEQGYDRAYRPTPLPESYKGTCPGFF